MDTRSHRLGAQMTKLTLMFLSTLSLSLLLISGCVTAVNLSQGNVPCSQDEIQIVDEEGALAGGNPTRWTAICHEKRYYCAARYSQYGAAEVDCIQADESIE